MGSFGKSIPGVISAKQILSLQDEMRRQGHTCLTPGVDCKHDGFCVGSDEYWKELRRREAATKKEG